MEHYIHGADTLIWRQIIYTIRGKNLLYPTSVVTRKLRNEHRTSTDYAWSQHFNELRFSNAVFCSVKTMQLTLLGKKFAHVFLSDVWIKIYFWFVIEKQRSENLHKIMSTFTLFLTLQGHSTSTSWYYNKCLLLHNHHVIGYSR